MFPLKLTENLDEEYKEKWNVQFVTPGRSRSEGLWRRTQQKETKEKSGWKSEEDARRRMVHFIDEYDVVANDSNSFDFVLKGVYLWVCVTLPGKELEEYRSKVIQALEENNWNSLGNETYESDGLSLIIKESKVHSEDKRADRGFPEHYATTEFTLQSENMQIEDRVIDSPWNVLSSGIRQIEKSEEGYTVVDDISKIEDYLPMQFELGGGASIELGIPPLNHLHQIYNVTDPRTGDFIFNDDPLLPNLINNPKDFYKEASVAYRASLLAKPNDFYLTLKELYDKGLVKGDVITNNFDGLISLVGLKEKFIRRFDEPEVYPTIEFDSDVKSLVVVGSHADRRKVQKQAREKGLKVIYIDPEEYFDYFGNKISYPLEGLKSQDYLIHSTAVEFAKQLKEKLNL